MRALRAVALVAAGLGALTWRRRAPAPAPASSPPSLSPDAIAQLIRDKDVAEAANAAKSRYLASVSHEIRSPLNAIYGYAQLVERQSGVDPREAARIIRRSAEHLTDLVEGLLDISLVENGVTRLASDVVRLSAFLDQIVRMFEPAAAAKGLAFRCEVAPNLPAFVRTDQKRLRQVLINLVGNAIKFTAQGSVTLRLRWSGQVATFEVEDTGPGIAPAERERIFAPFARGADEDGRSAGFGLGLPITRAIVHILGGDVAVDSAPGGGACFRVRLMLSPVAVPGADAPGPGRITGYAGQRRAILAVDDDVRQLSFVRQALEDVGLDVAVAPDGETALGLAQAQPFDLVLLDVQMAGRSGWETARHLRAAHGRALRIIMLSANAHERHGPTGSAEAEAAHDLFLLKPIEIGQMVDAIGQQLGLEWQREAAAVLPGAVREDALPDAAQPYLARLRDLVRIGHVRGIEAEIRALQAAVPQAASLVAQLYDGLDRFDLAAIGRKLESL